MGRTLAYLLPLACCLHMSNGALVTPSKYLIVSQPKQGTISYAHIGSNGLRGSGATMSTLIGSGLSTPMGIAVDQMHGQLVIADPNLNQIVQYNLHTFDGKMTADSPKVLVENSQARWVAVDFQGNVYYTSESLNQILQLSYNQRVKGFQNATILYNGNILNEVSLPGGIATDSFFTYWVNKQVGTQKGSVIKAAIQPQQNDIQANLETLVSNSDKSYGICMTGTNIFYTQPQTKVYGIKKHSSVSMIGAVGGPNSPVTITDRVANPRGCAFDGEGTVYVADRGQGSVLSFPANMQTLSLSYVTKSIDCLDAFGVSVYSRSTRSSFAIFSFVLILTVSVVGEHF